MDAGPGRRWARIAVAVVAAVLIVAAVLLVATRVWFATRTPGVNAFPTPAKTVVVASPSIRLGAPSSSPSGTPTGPSNGHTRPDLASFKRRCVDQAAQLDFAHVYAQQVVMLTRGRDYRFKVEVLPAHGVGPMTMHSQDRGRVALVCTVDARLVSSGDLLDVSPSTWESRRFVPPAGARWTWIVTARTYTSADAVMQLRPVVRVRQVGGVANESLGVAEYDVTFRVAAKPEPSFSTRVGNAVGSSWQAVVAIASGIGVLAGAILAVRKVRSRETDGA